MPRKAIELLSAVPHPEEKYSLSEKGMLSAVQVEGTEVRVRVSVPHAYPLSNVIKSDIEAVLAGEGYRAVVEFSETADTGAAAKRTVELPIVDSGTHERTGIDALPRGNISNIIAVASGKGGVGKSFVTAVLATHLSMLGFRTGILDADITGPCISRMFGLNSLPELGKDGKIVPLSSQTGVKIMTVDLIMDRFKTPLVWRGPLINSAIRGLFSETAWGKLHYLIVDLPPGTSDAPMTVFQSLTPDGVLFVTSPMEVARSVVARAVTMAREMHVPVTGVIENMAFLRLPDGSRVNVFGREGGEKAASELGVPYIGTIPLDPAVSGLSDRGEIELYSNTELFKTIRRMRFAMLQNAQAERQRKM